MASSDQRGRRVHESSAAYGLERIPETSLWYHGAGTFEAATGDARLYVNGAPDGNATFPISGITVTSERVLIGATDNSISFSPAQLRTLRRPDRRAQPL